MKELIKIGRLKGLQHRALAVDNLEIVFTANHVIRPFELTVDRRIAERGITEIHRDFFAVMRAEKLKTQFSENTINEVLKNA